MKIVFLLNIFSKQFVLLSVQTLQLGISFTKMYFKTVISVSNKYDTSAHRHCNYIICEEETLNGRYYNTDRTSIISNI